MNEFGVKMILMFLMESIMKNLLECFIICIWTVWGLGYNYFVVVECVIEIG